MRVSQERKPQKPFVVDGFVKKSLKNIIKKDYSQQNSDNINKNSFQNLMKLPFIVAQCCGLFPVIGVGSPSSLDLQFRWMAWRTVYSIFCISGNICMAVFFFYWISVRGLRYENMGSLVFYSTSLICTVLFLNLAKIWPKIAQEWAAVEQKFVTYPEVKNSRWKYKIILISILLIAFVEHSLAVGLSFGWIVKCTHENIGIVHIKADFPQWFCFIDYNHVKAFLIEYFNWVSTFNWNFNDIFIILISEILTEKFRQINEALKIAQLSTVSSNFYKSVREDYTLLSNLCFTVKESIKHIVTLSFSSNIAHICIQLYNILRPRDTLVEYFYFYFSLLFLIGRAVMVSVFASRINDESKVPLSLLSTVPSGWFNVEVSRLIQQIHTVCIAFTGSNFFFVTRTLLISVGGTVIAYELVLIQLPRSVSKAEIYLANATIAQQIAYMCNVTRLCEP